MSLLFTESFNTALYQGKYADWQSGNDISASYGRDGNGISLGDLNTTSGIGFNCGVGDERFIFGAWIKAADVVSGDLFLQVLDPGDNVIASIGINDSGNPTLYTGSLGTGYLSGTGNRLTNEWVFFEVQIDFATTATGSAQIFFNGELNASVSGVATCSTSTNWEEIRIGYDNSSWVDLVYIDSFYVADGRGPGIDSAIGPIQITVATVDGNGTYTQLTGSDGNQVDNWALLSDYNSATYVYGTAQGEKDSYTLADIDGNITGIKGISVYAEGNSGVSGTKWMRTFIRESATDYAGQAQTLTTSNKVVSSVWDVNPTTGSAWTPAEVSALETGVEIRDQVDYKISSYAAAETETAIAVVAPGPWTVAPGVTSETESAFAVAVVQV